MRRRHWMNVWSQFHFWILEAPIDCFALFVRLFVSTFPLSDVVPFRPADTFKKFMSPRRDSAAVGTKSNLNCSLHFLLWRVVLSFFFFSSLFLPHYRGDKNLITPPAFTISSVCFPFPIMQSSSVAILLYAPPAHLRMTEWVIFGMGRHYFSSTTLFSFFVLLSSHKPLSILFIFLNCFPWSFLQKRVRGLVASQVGSWATDTPEDQPHEVTV